MELQTLIYLFVGISFAIYIGIAFGLKAGSTKDFYVAGGGVHPVAKWYGNGCEIGCLLLHFISLAGIIAFKGSDGGAYLMGWTGGYVLLAMLLAPYLRKFGKFIVPDFVGDRYYSDTARLVLLLLVLFSFHLLMLQVKWEVLESYSQDSCKLMLILVLLLVWLLYSSTQFLVEWKVLHIRKLLNML